MSWNNLKDCMSLQATVVKSWSHLASVGSNQATRTVCRLQRRTALAQRIARTQRITFMHMSGGNNVPSLALETSKKKGLLNSENPPSKMLRLAFGNCSGQNKNGRVLKLVVCSVEMGHFEEVEFMFLIVGHAKNPADRLSNLLKADHRLMNLCTTKQSISTRNTNEFVTAAQAEEDVFKDFMEHQHQFHKPFETNTIKTCHMFLSHQQDDKEGVLGHFESDLIRQGETAYLEVAETLRSKGCLDLSDTKLLDDVLDKLEATKTKTRTMQHLTKRGTAPC
jgi:hypothetical protein